MNVNVTDIYDKTVIVDQYANLTAFTTLSDDYEAYKITNNSNLIDNHFNDYEAYKIASNSYLAILNNDIEN